MDNLLLSWDIGILNKLIGLIYKKNQYITLFNLRNLQKLMGCCDFSMYQNKSTIIKRVEFINRSLEAKLDKKLADESIIINYAKEDADDPIINDIINNLPKYKQLNHSEIIYLNKFIEDRLRYGSIRNYAVEIQEIINKIEDGEYSTYAEAFSWLNDWVDRFKRASRQISSEVNNNVLRFNDPNIGEKITDILSKLGSTQSIIISGIQMLNAMLAPGYRSSKLYCYAGTPGNFKSGILLKTVLDAIKYNAKVFRGKKDSHKKAAIYFTMENTIEESFERTYNMMVDKKSIIDYSSKYIEDQMKKMDIIGNEDMELIIAYRPNRSITTSDIRNFIEELDEEGIEVCLLCFDYVKRIRPAEKALTEKEELKNITNELRQIAIDFDIAVITAAQLNRQAASILSNAVRSGKSDALKEIDSSLIGSAWEIVENADHIILIMMQEHKKTKKLYLSFLFCKSRYQQPDIKYFNQPFDEKTFNLVDDIMDKKPAGLISLATDFNDIDLDDITPRGRKTISPTSNIIDNDIFNIQPL